MDKALCLGADPYGVSLPQLTPTLARHQVGGTAAFATVMHVAMHYMVMVQKADEDGGPTVTSNALGTRSGITGHIVLGLMALMFLTAWDRCVRPWRVGPTPSPT